MKRPAATPAALTPLPVGAALVDCAAALVVVVMVDPPLPPVWVDIDTVSVGKESVYASDKAVGRRFAPEVVVMVETSLFSTLDATASSSEAKLRR